ncbi:MAG: hypothetical protein GY869_08730, partial [Planctomycetes bacterium]|nr:hypothetical protein [Planctomycetota bacterium]
DCDWLSIDPQKGTSTDEISHVNIALVPANLTLGRHQCELTISDPTAYNNPKQVTVSVYVTTKGRRLVPNEYNTIQAAINDADEYDTIVVSPGIYHENILMGGKNIVLTSLDPNDPVLVADTVIEGDETSSVVTFSGSETAVCLLRGFTITGGYAVRGGGIVGNGTLATIDSCVIEYNTATDVGGGLQKCNGTIIGCIIRHNSGGDRGGAMGACAGSIINCLMHHNTADKGGALHNCDNLILNCTITSNTANTESVIRRSDGSFVNCIVWGNTPAGIFDCTASFNYNCLEWVDSGLGN